MKGSGMKGVSLNELGREKISNNSSIPHSPASVVVFRADASLDIGSGHIMRCLTLADSLVERGVECHFICREHQGHLIEAITARDIVVHRLPINELENGAVSEPQAGISPMLSG